MKKKCVAFVLAIVLLFGLNVSIFAISDINHLGYSFAPTSDPGDLSQIPPIVSRPPQ